jgi:hypothetical protein
VESGRGEAHTKHDTKHKKRDGHIALDASNYLRACWVWGSIKWTFQLSYRYRFCSTVRGHVF